MDTYCERCGELGFYSFCKKCGGRLGEWNHQWICPRCKDSNPTQHGEYCKQCGTKVIKLLKFDFPQPASHTTLTYYFGCTQCGKSGESVTLPETEAPPKVSQSSEPYCSSCGSRFAYRRHEYAKCRRCGHVMESIGSRFFIIPLGPERVVCAGCGGRRLKYYSEKTFYS